MAEIIIETEKLCCQSGQRYLLQDINWKVERGQHWCVFGMNGCGKTTLLSILAGYKAETSGTVKLFGDTFTNENVLTQRKRIGFVSSSFFDRYYRNETPLHIVLSGKTGGFGLDFTIDDNDVKTAKRLLCNLGLAGKIYRPFSTMSKGERQNVLLARALLTKPEILILDEPCSGLDVVARETVLHIVEQIANESACTMIYVTHYLEEVLPIFRNSLFLRDGITYAAGATEALFTSSCLSDFLRKSTEVMKTENNRYALNVTIGSDEKMKGVGRL